MCHEQDRIRVISGVHRQIAENCVLLGYYAANSGTFYRRFGTAYRSHPQDSRIPKKGFLNPEDATDRLYRNVGKKYHYLPRNNPEECCSKIGFLLLRCTVGCWTVQPWSKFWRRRSAGQDESSARLFHVTPWSHSNSLWQGRELSIFSKEWETD